MLDYIYEKFRKPVQDGWNKNKRAQPDAFIEDPEYLGHIIKFFIFLTPESMEKLR